MKKAFRAAAVAAAILFALTFIGSAKLKDESAHLLFSSSADIGGGAPREIRLKKGDRIVLGSYLGEPIIWRVIDTGDTALLMSEKVLCFKAFDPSEDGIGSSDYFTSPLRAWLNSRDGFLSTDNFSAAELALISADKNGDTVFLPSKDMLKNISAADRRKSPTEQCVKNDACAISSCADTAGTGRARPFRQIRAASPPSPRRADSTRRLRRTSCAACARRYIFAPTRSRSAEAAPPKIRMRWREVSRDERKA